MAAEPRWYLVDTNVLSNRSAAETDANVVAWLQRYARKIRISVVTVAEMHRGHLLQELKVGATSDRKVSRGLRSKRAWYNEVLDRFADRIEAIDLQAAQRWAEVSVRFPSLREGDKAIAASALARAFSVHLGSRKNSSPLFWRASSPVQISTLNRICSKGFGVATRNLGDFRQVGVALVNPFDRGAGDDDWDDDPIAALQP